MMAEAIAVGELPQKAPICARSLAARQDFAVTALCNPLEGARITDDTGPLSDSSVNFFDGATEVDALVVATDDPPPAEALRSLVTQCGDAGLRHALLLSRLRDLERLRRLRCATRGRQRARVSDQRFWEGSQGQSPHHAHQGRRWRYRREARRAVTGCEREGEGQVRQEGHVHEGQGQRQEGPDEGPDLAERWCPQQ